MTTTLPSHHHSSSLEKVLEHRFVAELTAALWLAGERGFEVLHSEVDAHGYDIVVDANDVMRHIQLKAMKRGGKRSRVNVNMLLAGKPSGCVVWYEYDPDTLQLGPFRWFGGLPRRPLPDLGDRILRHTKGNSEGLKAERAGHRVLTRTDFELLPDMAALVERLFAR